MRVYKIPLSLPYKKDFEGYTEGTQDEKLKITEKLFHPC